MKNKLLLCFNLFFLLISLMAKGKNISEVPGSSCSNPIVVEVYSAPLVNFEISSENFPNSITDQMITPASLYINGNNIIFSFELTGKSYVSASITGSYAGMFIFGTCPSAEHPAATLAFAGGGDGSSFSDVVLDAGTYFFVTGTWPQPQFTNKVINLSAQLVSTEPVLLAQPASLFTGLVPVGNNPAIGQLTLTNQGLAQAVINQSDISITGDNASNFSFAPSSTEVSFPVSLGFNEALVLDISFSPTGEGLKEATLVVNYHAGADPLQIPISGQGYLPFGTFFENFSNTTMPNLPAGWNKILTISGNNVFVDVTNLGSPLSPPHHARISNGVNTSGTSMLISPMVTNLGSSRLLFDCKLGLSFHTGVIEVGFITDITDPETFTLVETVPVTGTYTNYIVSFADAVDIVYPTYASIAFRHPVVVNSRTYYVDNITYQEQPAGPIFTTNKTEIDFGNVYLNTLSTQTLTITNAGTGVLTLNENDFSISGPDAENFGFGFPFDMEWPVSIDGQQSHIFTFNFLPTEVGPYTATLAIEDNIAGKVINSFPLLGSGYDPTVSPPFVYNFTGSFPPTDWMRFTGVLSATTTLNPTTIGWTHSKFGNQQSHPVANATKANLWGAVNFWLISPPIDMGNGQTDYILSFDLAKTGWNNTNPANMGPNQSFRVLVKSSDSPYWTPADVVQQWTHEDFISHTGENVNIDLSDFSGTVQVAFLGSATGSGDIDIDIHITNVEMKELAFYSVTFNISDNNGNLINDAAVTLDDQTLSGAPYVFEDLLAGVYHYQVTKPGFLPLTGDVSVTDGDVVVNISLVQAFSVHFTVTDGINPVANASISLFDSQDNDAGVLLTNELGQASQALSPGSYTYDVFAYTFNELTNQSFVIGGEDVSLTTVLTRPESVQLPFVENFNSQQLPTGWAIVNQGNHTSPQSWEFVQTYDGNSIDGTAFLFIDSDGAGSGVQLNSMIYTTLIDAADIQGDLMLEFDHYYFHISSSFGRVEVWDGNQWQQIANYNSTIGSWSQPQQASFNITDHANDNLQVRFHYNDVNAWAWWWAIDNISITDVVQHYDLTLEVIPAGSGTVSGDGLYVAGEQVTVEAMANDGYFFINWTDYDDLQVSADALYTFTMPAADVMLKANFQEVIIETYTLELVALPVDGGILSGGGEYEQSAEVNVTADANEGYVFLSWKLNDAVISTVATFTFIMPANAVTLVATFEQEVVNYTLSLVAQPSEAGEVSGGGVYEQGHSVSITASAHAGYDFVNWTDEDNNEISSQADFTYIMPGENVTLTANFQAHAPTFVLTLLAEPAGWGNVSGAGEYTQGHTVNISATANTGYVFISWTDLNDVVVSTEPDFIFTMPGHDITLRANFQPVEPDTFILTLAKFPENSGNVTGAGEYPEGHNISISAIAGNGYVFENWTDQQNVVISTEADFEFTMPAHDVIFTANFNLETGIYPLADLNSGIYPNPARNQFTVKSEIDISRILIYDLTGSIVMDKQVNSDSVIIRQNLPVGIYLVNIITSRGVKTQKLVIQK